MREQVISRQFWNPSTCYLCLTKVFEFYQVQFMKKIMKDFVFFCPQLFKRFTQSLLREPDSQLVPSLRTDVGISISTLTWEVHSSTMDPE